MVSQIYSLINGLWRAPGRTALGGVPVVTPTPSAKMRVARLSATGTVKPPVSGNFDRDTLVYGQYNPKETGYYGPNPGTLTGATIGGPGVGQDVDYNVTSDGQIVEGLTIYGNINLGTHANVIIRNCVIYGTEKRGSGTASIVASNSNYRGALVVDCHLTQRSARHNEWAVPVLGCANLTVNRCEIDGYSDGLTLNNRLGGGTFQGNYIHDGYFNEWDISEGTDSSGVAQYSGGWLDTSPKPKGYYPYSAGTLHYTHADCCQFYVGPNWTVRGNYFGGVRSPGVHNASPSQADTIRQGHDFYNSCIMLKQEVDSSAANKVQNVMIENNWFWGGVCTINFPYDNGNNFATTTVRNNWFLKQTWSSSTSPSYYMLRSNDSTGTPIGVVTGNRLVDPVTYADLGDLPISRGN